MDPKGNKPKKARNRKSRGGRTKRCAVKGCDSVVGGKQRFFTFPKDKKNGGFAPWAKLWNVFTRVKDFKPLRTQVLCELHFTPDCIIKHKNALRPRTAPSIYYRNGKKIEVPYDLQTLEYYGEEAQRILEEIEQTPDDEHIKALRYDRMKEYKTLCRFCFTSRLCSPLSKFESHSIDFSGIIKFLGITDKHAEIFNEIICSPCFEKIIDFERYRLRCQAAHKKLIDEIDDLDKRAQIKHKTAANASSDKASTLDDSLLKGFKPQSVDNEPDPLDTESGDSTIANDFCDDQDGGYSDNDYEDLIDAFPSSPVKNEGNKCEVMIKNEPAVEFSNDEKLPRKRRFIDPEPAPSSCKRKRVTFDIEPITEVSIKTEDFQEQPPAKSKSKDPEEAPKNAKKFLEPRALKRSFECFFCRVKFVGFKSFSKHECQTKTVKCEVEGCDTSFVSQAGYNQHIYHRHGLPKICKRYCPACNTSYQMNAIMFDRHCRKCTQENDFKDKKIKCPLCSMVCDNIRIYAAHRMIHETKNLKKSVVNEKGMRVVPKKPKGKDEVCDLCGKSFDGPGLQKHKQNVHLVNFTGAMFHCDKCPIAKPTKRLLQNHIRRTHVVKWHPCEICGKMFKNRDTWKKHQLVHGNTKDENRCDVCPTAPGFVTKTELKKHMATYHGGAKPVRKFICDICDAAYSRVDQLVRHKAGVHQVHENQYTDEIISQYLND